AASRRWISEIAEPAGIVPLASSWRGVQPGFPLFFWPEVRLLVGQQRCAADLLEVLRRPRSRLLRKIRRRANDCHTQSGHSPTALIDVNDQSNSHPGSRDARPRM